MTVALRTIVGLLTVFLAVAYAGEQHLRYEGEAEIYDLTFDDSRIPVNQMRLIAELSPYVDFSPRFTIGVEVRKVDGKEVFDKLFLAPGLELCIEQAGVDCTRNPDIPDAAFLKNAAHNLQTGAEQTEELRHEELPSDLEPVREYLLQNLRHFREMEQARYDYLESGNVEPLRRILCAVCPCPAEADLLDRLAAEKDARKKLAIARSEWHNEVLRCEREQGPRYPINAWDRFIKDYGVVENRRQGRIE